MVCYPKAEQDRQAAHVFQAKIVGTDAVEEHYQWFSSDLSIRVATVTKVNFDEFAFTSADL